MDFGALFVNNTDLHWKFQTRVVCLAGPCEASWSKIGLTFNGDSKRGEF